MYLDGLELKKIAQKLNTDNTPTRQVKRWCDQAVRNILTNEVYVGTSIFGKNRRGPISVADNTWGD